MKRTLCKGRVARTPGFNGYGEVMSVDEINKVEGFAGKLSKQIFRVRY